MIVKAILTVTQIATVQMLHYLKQTLVEVDIMNPAKVVTLVMEISIATLIVMVRMQLTLNQILVEVGTSIHVLLV